MARKMTVKERKQVEQAQRLEAVATLSLVKSVREMIGEELARATSGLPREPGERAIRPELQAAFDELHARIGSQTFAQAPKLEAPTVFKLEDDGPEFTEDEAKEFMRKLHEVVSGDLAGTLAANGKLGPTERKFLRVCADFKEKYEHAALIEKISDEVAALQREIVAMRDLSQGAVIGALLGAGPKTRGAS